MPEDLNPEQQWPGVDAAFDFVIPSYQWTITRFEAADSRIQTLQAFIATVTFGIPALAAAISKTVPFKSPWFIAALIVAALALASGIIARNSGALMICSPEVLYQKWLSRSAWNFKKDMLYFAGRHFDQNVKVINRKAHIALGMTLFFFLETTLFIGWIISAFAG